MKLYYAPGACSLSPHIALCEAGLSFELVKVDLGTKKTASGEDFCTINPDGYVPALQLDNGVVLTEGPAIVQYIADLVPEKNLAPANGSLARYQLQSQLNYIATELHKTLGALFAPGIESRRDAILGLFSRRLNHAASQLAKTPYLMGDVYTVADAYLFTVLGWAPHLKIDLSPWPSLTSFIERMGSRPAVQAALRAEGLL